MPLVIGQGSNVAVAFASPVSGSYRGGGFMGQRANLQGGRHIHGSAVNQGLAAIGIAVNRVSKEINFD